MRARCTDVGFSEPMSFYWGYRQEAGRGAGVTQKQLYWQEEPGSVRCCAQGSQRGLQAAYGPVWVPFQFGYHLHHQQLLLHFSTAGLEPCNNLLNSCLPPLVTFFVYLLFASEAVSLPLPVWREGCNSEEPRPCGSLTLSNSTPQLHVLFLWLPIESLNASSQKV